MTRRRRWLLWLLSESFRLWTLYQSKSSTQWNTAHAARDVMRFSLPRFNFFSNIIFIITTLIFRHSITVLSVPQNLIFPESWHRFFLQWTDFKDCFTDLNCLSFLFQFLSLCFFLFWHRVGLRRHRRHRVGLNCLTPITTHHYNVICIGYNTIWSDLCQRVL